MLRGIGSALWGAGQTVANAASATASAFHDMAVGSSDLSTRKFDEFMQDAKIIEDAGYVPGAKLSFGPGFHPSYEFPGAFQGAARAVKRWSGASDADGLKVSKDCILWADACKECCKVISDEQKVTFRRVVNTLNAQAMLYQQEYKKICNPNEQELLEQDDLYNATIILTPQQRFTRIIANFQKAAEIVGQIYEKNVRRADGKANGFDEVL